MTDELIVQDNQVVSMAYVLRVNGELIDSSSDDNPLQFIQGKGHIISGLESALYGMGIGESKSVNIEPADGYGLVDSEAFMDLPRSEFPKNIPIKPGLDLQLKNQDGEVVSARIDSVNDDAVHLDLNHPLAGKELQFDVKIVSLRQATDEELAHDHVHEE